MKKLLIAAICSLTCSFAFAQKQLPAKEYAALHDSITSIDVTLYKGGSLSMDGKSATSFSRFFVDRTTAKTNTQPQGMIMWQINGREFLSGKLFLGDSTGYVVITQGDKEYVNVVNREGTQFFKDRIKK